MAIDFVNSGSDIVNFKLNANRYEASSVKENLFEEFQVNETWKWITDNSFKRVSLQFPEDMFHISPIICLELQQRANGKVAFAVLAEKKYGSCCIDEIGAEHFSSDCIVHYGMACLSPHPRFPVKYIFARRCLDLDDFVKQIKSIEELMSSEDKELVVVYDLAYHHLRDDLVTRLVNSGAKFYCPEIVPPSSYDSLASSVFAEEGEKEDFEIILGRKFYRQKGLKLSHFVYIGADDSCLTTFMIIFNQASFTLYEPTSKCLYKNIARCSKLLMKRYYMMEKARDSQFVAILVGTLDVSGYAEVIDKIKLATRIAGKKCRVYSPGTLNPAKLANLSEFDTYILVACPLNTFINSSEYYQPIVTPYEMILACSQEFRWSTNYKINFEQVLCEPVGATNNKQITDVSLLTGKIRKIGIDEDEVTNKDGTLIKNISSDLVTSSDFLHSRTWQGLQPKFGETPVSKCIEGSVGTASGYYHEIHGNIEDF